MTFNPRGLLVHVSWPNSWKRQAPYYYDRIFIYDECLLMKNIKLISSDDTRNNIIWFLSSLAVFRFASLLLFLSHSLFFFLSLFLSLSISHSLFHTQTQTKWNGFTKYCFHCLRNGKLASGSTPHVPFFNHVHMFNSFIIFKLACSCNHTI